ncbi:ABC transporter substrate-binding protein [Nitratireductor indicus]|uniref:Putative ABC transporter substrate binding protein n=1 Tax=Nitratireductor indicus C115 TaxID=1231190 RepID=K2MZS4_9HYPH|nr:ABC transporter substrate-binding protein [Nitratireductor indicus]EKF40753.1 putative ABC transporter substrate binding protein [Nitratireductor indicus C115]MDS1136416.1 ABC transporter substrate-binding protein [Nitratireductor indicus]SFQ75759.1 NitT/TauT family transport system substrate-binding protein [Nitratireductor indicus]
MTMNRRKLLGYGAQLSALLALGVPGRAAAETRSVPFSLDFRIYGGNSPFFLGNAAGIYENAGFTAALEGASGSADCVRRLATGTHDFGFADIMTLIEFSAANPDGAPRLIMPILDHSPASIMTIGGDKITSLEQLKGKKIGVAANSAATKIMPGILKLNNIAPDEIEFTAVDVRIRDTMLLKGEVDGVVGYDYTSVFNFVGNGVKREDINILYFSDFGFDFPANALIASQKMIDQEPELCKAVALGAARAWGAAYKDPGAAVDAAVAREPLLVRDVELQRLQFILDTHISTESVKEHGIGYLEPERISKGLALMAEGFGLSTQPKLEDFYADGFLPDAQDLKILG